jgi:hypothetical protein
MAVSGITRRVDQAIVRDQEHAEGQERAVASRL